MKFADEHRHFIINSYKEGKSTYEIAESLHTYSNKIIRSLNYLGVDRRGYGEAQQKALKTGRSSHPTEGKSPSTAHRERISEGMAKVWENMPVEEKDRRSEISRDQWAAMSDEDKVGMRILAAEAVRVASKEGSKAEKFVRKGLTKAGWDVQFHVKSLMPNTTLEVDLFVPGVKTAIEIDGPSHFLPIWGEEKLKKHQTADARKSGLLVGAGYVLIRVKQIKKSLSQKDQRDILQSIVIELEKVKQDFPPKSKRIIEIEVT